MQPPYEHFKHATCAGSYLMGTACGSCERCQWEATQIIDSRPQPPEMEKFGKRVHSWIETPSGSILCPIDHLEMGYNEGDAQFGVLYCGSGNLGDGHWLLADEVFGVIAEWS